jgi:RNA polymerase sigma factor (sigma-70 family)
MPEHTNNTADVSVDRMERIAALRTQFLNFLSRRLGDRATTEDVLQSAYIKALEHGGGIRKEQSTVAWFYRILRNAIVDHYRRASARDRADADFAAQSPTAYEAELEQTVCACIEDVIRDLKSDYREAIERVDLGGQTVEDFARTQQITPNNASVRLYRARKAVSKELTMLCGTCAEHKCLDCSCRRSQL